METIVWIAATSVTFVLLVAVVIATATSLLARQKRKESGERRTPEKASGVVETIKKAAKGCPSWLATTVGVTAGGWLFFLFTVYELLPLWWQWFVAHPRFLWMPPASLTAMGALVGSKRWGGKLLAGLITAGLITLAFIFGTWRAFNETSANGVSGETAALKPSRFENCRELTGSSATVTAPAHGTESPCFIIPKGVWFRMDDYTRPVRLRWQSGIVKDLYPKSPGHSGDSIRYAAFTLESLDAVPVFVTVLMEKKKKK